ncbi:hypothetical protein [uncultured Alistipes sp.]|uniref:hypothetical protein n=1 Tax=uncultured Alistipes sp. TaxID=538949 RepID=UPI00272A84FC|nr:hypothetical protein [uncultured Alistipes sp.]
MATIKEKIERLKKELEEASNDEKFRNLAFVAGGNLTKSGRAYIRRQTEKICRLSHEYDLYIRIQRIIDGEVFTLDDIDQCRLEIEKRYPQYQQPLDASSGILFAAEAIRKSFGNRFYLILYRYPIKIDFGTPNRRICIIHPSNFIEYEKKREECLLFPLSS